MKTTNAQNNAAEEFSQAFNDFKNSTPANRAELDRQLDLTMARYRKAHGLCDGLGLLDLINHFNRTHA